LQPLWGLQTLAKDGFAGRNFSDGIGVHYVDAFIKPMNVKLEDGTPVRCKRRGLKIVLSAGARKGEGLMRRIDVSADPAIMLNAALQEAAKAAGIEFMVEDGAIFCTL